MRTLELLRSLTDAEVREVDEIIAAKKREGIKLLHGSLKKYRNKEGVPETAALFETVFGEKYVDKKNYLLRNELRLLNEVLYEYIALEAIKNHLKSKKSTFNTWLAQGLAERDLIPVFESEIDKYIDQSKTGIRAEDTAHLLNLKHLWMIKHQVKNRANLQEQLDVQEEWLDAETQRFKHRLREAEARRAYLENCVRGEENKDKISDFRTPEITRVDMPVDENDWFERYLILKKYSFQSSHDTRIEVLRDKLAMDESERYIAEFGPAHQYATLNNLSMEMIFQHRYEEADEFLQEAVARYERNDYQTSSAAIQNYLANQLNLARYQKGLDIYDAHVKDIAGSRSAQLCMVLRAFMFIGLNRPDEALAALPPLAGMREQNYLMARTVFIVAYFLRGNYALALNECRNSETALKTRKGFYEKDYQFIIKLLARYIKIYEKNLAASPAGFASLAKDMEKDKARIYRLRVSEFALLWLVREMENKGFTITPP